MATTLEHQWCRHRSLTDTVTNSCRTHNITFLNDITHMHKMHRVCGRAVEWFGGFL